MVGEKVAVVEKLHTASVCERENLDGQTDKHKIEIIFSVKDSWLSHIFVCSRCPEYFSVECLKHIISKFYIRNSLLFFYCLDN